MPTYVALLRAINVGGTGKLAMRDLVALCERAGLTRVRTYIQSGNVVFASRAGEKQLKGLLGEALAARLKKPVGVLVRRADELERVLADNPFPDAAPNRVIVLFLDEAPSRDVLDGVETPGGEELALVGRELYVHYPGGQGQSRLKVPLAAAGTGRNLNTVTRLVALARET
jgi:uncharacterized protein (DUF1697 family)